jgi:hypothetical protein
MRLLPSGCVVLLVTLAWACSSNGAATLSSLSPSPIRPQPVAITLNGRVTDAGTAGPIAGAVVSINGRYRGTSDDSGNFSVAGLLDYGGNHDHTYVSAENYVADYRYIRGTIQNVRLYRIERIVAGASKLVTIEPDDTLCVKQCPGHARPRSGLRVQKRVRHGAETIGRMNVVFPRPVMRPCPPASTARRPAAGYKSCCNRRQRCASRDGCHVPPL